jgi:antitoxin component YwqK of YwqJK toxin-antitoxin module
MIGKGDNLMADAEIKGLLILHTVYTDYAGQTENNKPNGWGKASLPDGKIYEGEWKDGKMHGKMKEFYPDGMLEFEGEYKDGFRNGYGKSYLRDGTLRYEGNWINGERADERNTHTNWA